MRGHPLRAISLPFEPLEPNVETIEAVKAARRGELVTGGSTGMSCSRAERGRLATTATLAS